MAIVLGVLAALAIISAVGSASKVQRRRATQLSGTTRSKSTSIALPALPAAEPASVQELSKPERSAEVESPESAQPSPPRSIEPEPAQATVKPEPVLTTQQVEAEPQPIESDESPTSVTAAIDPPTSTPNDAPPFQSNPVAAELAESILEMMPDVPLATSLLVSEVVNPEGNNLGVQLDRSNAPTDTSESTHHSANLLNEIAELDAGGDRIAQLAQLVEHPDSTMRVQTAFTLGDLATRTQGAERDEIIKILVRLSQDVDPQVRTQAAAALGGIENPVIGESRDF